MGYIYLKGKSWTRTRLDTLISGMSRTFKSKIIESYWEYVSDDSLPIDVKVEQVVCAIPNGASYSGSIICKMLRVGPSFVNKKDYVHSKPNIAKRLYDEFGKPKIDAYMRVWGVEHKHCPMNQNTEWCLLIWIAGVIGLIMSADIPEVVSIGDNLYKCVASSMAECLASGDYDLHYTPMFR